MTSKQLLLGAPGRVALGIVIAAAALALAATSSTPSHSVEVHQEAACQSFTAGVASLRADYADDLKVVEFTPEQLTAVTQWYNALPPVSDEHYNHGYTLGDPTHPGRVMLLLTLGDCVQQAGFVPISTLVDVLEGV